MVRRRKRSVGNTLFIELVNSDCRHAGIAETKHGLLDLVLCDDERPHYLQEHTPAVNSDVKL